jgi:hypothetical protein
VLCGHGSRMYDVTQQINKERLVVQNEVLLEKITATATASSSSTSTTTTTSSSSSSSRPATKNLSFGTVSV